MGSSCHRITATILSIDSVILAYRRVVAAEQEFIDQALLDEGCAMIHFYRFGGMGAAIGYNILIEDEIATRVRNNYRESVKVKAIGPVTLLARTEVKSELPLDLRPGIHYYVRCSVAMGFAVGHPKLELVDTVTGETEYNSIRDK